MRKVGRNVAIGIACGTLGVALAFGVSYFGGGSLFDLHILPAVVAALFVGSFAGVVAGAFAAIGLLGFSLFCPSLGSGALLAAGTMLSVLVVVVARKWMFYGERPAMMPAALIAVVAEVCCWLVHLLFGPADVVSVSGEWLAALPVSCAVAAVVAAVCSLAFRVRQRELPNAISTGVLLGLFAVVYGVWFAQGSAAVNKAVKTAEAFETDALVSVDYPIEPELLHEAQRMVDAWGTVDKMAAANLSATASDLGYELVAAVGGDGVIRASNVPQTVGFRLTDSEMLGQLCALNSGSRYCAVEFHRPDAPMDVAGRHWVKFVGIAFPGGGFAMVGKSYADIRKREYLFEASMLDWHVGNSGFMLIIDRKNDRIVAGFSKEDTGKTIAESGLSDLVETGVGRLLTGKVFGIRSLVHPVDLDLVEQYEGCIVMPFADVMATRNAATLVVLVLCTVLFIAGALILSKIVKQGRDIAELRRREDEKRQKDMDLAKSIQISSLERNFPPGVHAIMRMAREVGGDFYDCFACEPGKLMLVIADVSGKGIPASLFMMRARTEFRAVSKELNDIAEIMGEVNSRLCKNNDAEMFVTAWIGRLDLATGEVEWASAGHNPPYVARAGGALEQVTGRKSLVLAGNDGVKYKSNLLKLKKGDRLFLYTDGVTEAQTKTGDFYGKGRLEDVLDKTRGTPEEICRAVLDSVDRFAEDAPQADDITMMSVCWS